MRWLFSVRIDIALMLVVSFLSSGCGQNKTTQSEPSPASPKQPNAGSDSAISSLPLHMEIQTGLKDISSLAVTPDGKTAAVHGKGDKKNLEVWNLETKTKTLELDNLNGGRRDIALSTDGKKLLFEKIRGAAEVEIATKKTNDLLATGDGYTFSPTADAAVTVSYGKVHIWDLAKAKDWEWQADKDNNNISVKVYWGKSGRVAVGHKDGTISLWELESGKPIKTLTELRDKAPKGLTPSGHSPVAWSPDGKLLVTSGTIDPYTIWNVDTGKIEKSIEVTHGYGDPVFLPDGKSLVYSKSKSGSQTADSIVIERLDTGVKKEYSGHTVGRTVFAVSPDGKTLYTAGEKSSSLRAWKLDGQ